MNGIERIAAERARQVEEKGYTPAHDDTHTAGELAEAAIAYALAGYGKHALAHQFLPWEADLGPAFADPIRALEKAGALIAAEIDRLLRLDGGTDEPAPAPTPAVRRFATLLATHLHEHPPVEGTTADYLIDELSDQRGKLEYEIEDATGVRQLANWNGPAAFPLDPDRRAALVRHAVEVGATALLIAQEAGGLE